MMNFLKQLFRQQEENPKAPLVKEPLVRSSEEKRAYSTWKNGEARKRVVAHVHREIRDFFDGGRNDKTSVIALDGAQSRGFIFKYDDRLASADDFQHFFDLLQEEVLALNYKKYMSDRRQFNEPTQVRTIERHYVKPRTNLVHALETGTPINQLYGNITIEYLLVNEQPVEIKFLSQPYTGRNYMPTLSFEELVGKILR